MDWDRMMANTARGTDFTGRSAADEQAYFEAFGVSSGTDMTGASSARIGLWCAALIGFVQTAFVLK